MMQSNSDVLDEMHFRNVFVVQFAIFIIFICIVVILVWSGTIIDESYYTIDEKNDPL
jgi:F0F1-type ATP synthase membrane subunit b/b'